MKPEKKLEPDVQVRPAELDSRISAMIGLFHSRTEAASVAGMSTDQLARYEKGSTPSFPPLIKLARAKGVRLEWLATGAGPMLASELPPAPRAEPDEALLLAAVQVIEQALELTRRTATPEVKADLIVTAYKVLLHEENVGVALNDVLAAVRSSLGEAVDGR